MTRHEAVEDWVLYHVYNRGNNRQQLFFEEEDYQDFIAALRSCARHSEVEVPVYAIMPNHFHLIVQQRAGGNLSSMMERVATSAAMRFNEKYERIGHAFQGPYRYKSIAEDAIWYVACYVHLNPVRAGLASHPRAWKFSNYRDYADAEITFEYRAPGSSAELGKEYVKYVEEIVADRESERRFWRKIISLGNIGGNTGRYRRASAVPANSKVRDSTEPYSSSDRRKAISGSKRTYDLELHSPSARE